MPALIYPLMVGLSLVLGGAWMWLPLAFNLLLVPLADAGMRKWWPDWQPSVRLQRRLFAPWSFVLYAVMQTTVLATALCKASQGLSGAEWFAWVSAVGIMTGTAGITAAHELVHRGSSAMRALGLSLLAMVGYMHFRIEHVYGHHRHVATADDPGSAPLGQSFPQFFAHMLVAGPAAAWRIETRRLRRRGLPWWSARNRMLHYLAIQSGLIAAIAVVLGPAAVLFFALQSLMAVHLLEAVNYVQHYGLRRRRRGAGWQSVGPEHAWDSIDPVSGLLVFNLSRHADHHADVRRTAADLRVHAQSPRLPLSFYTMVFVALIPPLWHALMDARARRVAAADRASTTIAGCGSGGQEIKA